MGLIIPWKNEVIYGIGTRKPLRNSTVFGLRVDALKGR